MDNPEYRMLVHYIREKISIDGSLYKDRPFKRRLAVRMRSVGAPTYGEYLLYLKKNKEEIDKLKDTLTINVTRFFRNRETFDYLEHFLSKAFVKGKSGIRVLSAGSSSGEEAYSLAIMLDRIGRVHQFEYRIIGIDIDEDAVKKAREGIYNEYSFAETTEDEKAKCFTKVGKEWAIAEKYRKNVSFVGMDIKNEEQVEELGMFDMIVCRNILIYFSKEFQERILSMFSRMLKDKGILVLGKVEIIMGSAKKSFEPENIKERIYRKIADNS